MTNFSHLQAINKMSDSTVSADLLNLPVIDFSTFFNHDNDIQAYLNECNKLSNALHLFGCALVRDPRVSEAENQTFLDQMEKYFEISDGQRDARPEVHYQVGVTPAFTEKAKDNCLRYGAYGENDRPLSLCPPEADAKWRFFW